LNRYRVLLPLEFHTDDATYKQGDEFEHEFSEDDETKNLASGHLEIVPCEYKVIGGSQVYETNPGDTFTAALPMGQEAMLVQGGHIERVAQPAAKAKKKKEE
jgi:hypothetical protein